MKGDSIAVQFAMVALGGAVGAVARYILTIIVPSDEPLSWGVFAANFIGCFLICFISFAFFDMTQIKRLFLFIGFFGAFTTMSSVSLEMVQYSTEVFPVGAFLFFVLSAAICLAAGFMGRWLASTLQFPNIRTISR
ncbi:fluoride efflux transporter FluC [Candidatus Methanoplasma termitum]|uniref:fluoride efflux transporter FluC n=1 Tax=Candidatus Methanoplasma termitum TaxID=1577791 RepID=UPI00064E9642|nr:CrcB family protein [Candidatus Methanoplasma termitum]MCL2333593.1 CrcB family protein [Candidatus Methanoplasma sp.]